MNVEKGIVSIVMLALGICVLVFCDIKGAGTWMLIAVCGGVLVTQVVDMFRK